ncbi:hypothetical protein LOAG_14008 [Loa loa]|uniref:Uncharacterized protein n=1 Tax=Loa loa TaxID=7209 RepID=A0A1S0TIH6_LOALO|nr:hypothetical protein LOAG_14008 [Loa loa]EFO14510.2 hypothetical protein LOAG_14008 [Loa loa]
MNDDCHDVDNDGENVDDAMGSVHDGDDNNAAMGHPSCYEEIHGKDIYIATTETGLELG